MLRAVPYQFLSLRRLPQPRIVRHADSAFSLPSLASSSRSATPQLPDPVPLITISKEEGFRLPPLQQSIEDEGKDDHWQRARGGVHAQAVGISIHSAARRGMIEVMQVRALGPVHLHAIQQLCRRAARVDTTACAVFGAGRRHPR